MNNKLKYVFMPVMTIIISCNNTGTESIDNVEALQITKVLESKIIKIDTDLLNPGYIQNVNDQYLVVMDKTEEEIFKVFNLPELDFLYSWGRTGRGPDELSMLSFGSLDVKDSEVIVFDVPYLKYYSVTDSTFIFSHEEPIYFDRFMTATGFQHFRENLFVTAYDGEYEFVVVSPDEQEPLFLFGEYPSTRMEENNRFYEFAKIWSSKPDASKLVVFYVALQRFKIFDREGNLLVEKEIHDPFIPEFQGRVEDDWFSYRSFSFATDNYIYVMAPNGSRDDYNQEEFRPTLEVWSWDGQPVHRLKFDEKIDHIFTVSEKYQKLYAYSQEAINEIYVYDLPEILSVNQ